jgi:hypothetical protein
LRDHSVTSSRSAGMPYERLPGGLRFYFTDTARILK